MSTDTVFTEENYGRTEDLINNIVLDADSCDLRTSAIYIYLLLFVLWVQYHLFSQYVSMLI